MWLLQIQIQKKGFFVFLFSRVIHRWYVCDFYKYKYNRKEFLYFWFLGLSIGGMYVTGVKSETQEGRLVWGRLPQHLPQIFNPFFYSVPIVLIVFLSVSHNITDFQHYFYDKQDHLRMNEAPVFTFFTVHQSAMMVMTICRTIISQTSNSCSLGSRWAREKPKKGKSSKYNF